jgi:hypothetical protein
VSAWRNDAQGKQSELDVKAAVGICVMAPISSS